MPSVKIRNLSEYVLAIKDNQLTGCISRGERTMFKRPLTSAFARDKYSCNLSKLFDEYKLQTENMLNAHQKTHLEAFAQHQGLPINLLDFSQSPLISLYFAVADDMNEDNNSYVYFIKKNQIMLEFF